MSRTLEQSRAVPVPAEVAYRQVLPMPLPELFAHRYLALPPIREVREQHGEWGSAGVGQSRTIVLADGGTMHETLTSLEEGRTFAYRIDGISGPMRPLVASVEGSWTFTPAGTGTRVTWRWVVTPANRAGAAVMPVFARMWQGYARRAMDVLEQHLVPS